MSDCESRENYIFTSESVSEGHPDKVADYIADSILDAHLAGHPEARVACEVLCKGNHLVIAGEITSLAVVDVEQVARTAIAEIGYTDPNEPFSAERVAVQSILTEQEPEIAKGVNRQVTERMEQGAGDQGIMFGYASAETPEMMPLPILLAHRLSRGLADHRRNGEAWLRPDSKTQVTVMYRAGKPVEVTDVLVSTQHRKEVGRDEITTFVRDTLAPGTMGDWWHDGITVTANPTGSFVEGGPSADCGVTGRKIIVDTYGGMGRHGGGAFSGKDPSKVDRSGAYFCRYVARQLIREELAQRAEIQVAYAIGVSQPVSVKVDTFGTGDEDKAAAFVRGFDFRPRAIIERLDLLRPIYRSTTNYGHFGKPELPWEC